MEKQANLRTIEQNRKLYFMFNRLGIHDADAIAEIVYEHTKGRTHHTSELTFSECRFLIASLDDLMKNKQTTRCEDLDKKRKGVLKAIFRWYELRGVSVTMEYVIATACRAAGTTSFNAISAASLSRIYAEFCSKQRVVETQRYDDIIKFSQN